jgi:hypothetical protein
MLKLIEDGLSALRTPVVLEKGEQVPFNNRDSLLLKNFFNSYQATIFEPGTIQGLLEEDQTKRMLYKRYYPSPSKDELLAYVQLIDEIRELLLKEFNSKSNTVKIEIPNFYVIQEGEDFYLATPFIEGDLVSKIYDDYPCLSVEKQETITAVENEIKAFMDFVNKLSVEKLGFKVLIDDNISGEYGGIPRVFTHFVVPQLELSNEGFTSAPDQMFGKVTVNCINPINMENFLEKIRSITQ